MDGRVDDADISPKNNGDQVACKSRNISRSDSLHDELTLVTGMK